VRLLGLSGNSGGDPAGPPSGQNWIQKDGQRVARGFPNSWLDKPRSGARTHGAKSHLLFALCGPTHSPNYNHQIISHAHRYFRSRTNARCLSLKPILAAQHHLRMADRCRRSTFNGVPQLPNPHRSCAHPRGFVHGRFPYAGPYPAARSSLAGIRKPSPCRSLAALPQISESGHPPSAL
jgi:hypothetical protein